MPLSTTSSVGDKRAANGAPRPARPQKQQRRLSLPVSAHSSTVITKPKVDRRRSLRRQSSSFSSKENKYNRALPNPHFSPPETRSAKKKRLQTQFMQGGAGALFTFSPPNQAENARREKEEIERKEQERYVHWLVGRSCV